MIDLKVGDGVPDAVVGDALRIKQVLLNLVNNAIKFTERGRIELGVGNIDGNRVEFSVSDTGPGMNADMRSRLFGRFEQSGDAAHSRGSSGLGLSICRELVELMGGTIVVDSAPGKGSCFRIRLPLQAATASDSGAPTSSRTDRQDSPPDPGNVGDTTSRHVLVVED
ncbi:sensor histidine kinase, partial [Dokdonella sp.]|uniref:sensor histidine kinase n=1 Tax=Dokdonella sp. TaxID=2291710 RepID=UPI003C3C6AB6